MILKGLSNQGRRIGLMNSKSNMKTSLLIQRAIRILARMISTNERKTSAKRN
jgi:hypothetical protein